MLRLTQQLDPQPLLLAPHKRAQNQCRFWRLHISVRIVPHRFCCCRHWNLFELPYLSAAACTNAVFLNIEGLQAAAAATVFGRPLPSSRCLDTLMRWHLALLWALGRCHTLSRCAF